MKSMQALGDQAALVYFADEGSALGFVEAVRSLKPSWLVDVVQAYSSVAVFFDTGHVAYREVAAWLPPLCRVENQTILADTQMHLIPCCYEFQLDLERVANFIKVSAEEVIRQHCQTEYTVYAIGFCPGFPFLGYLPSSLCGVPRLDQPRVRVDAGSIGLTGRQTGIYTEPRPGGWNIIGRTPLELVSVEDNYFPLRSGHRVRFDRIDKKEFRRLQGKRLGAVNQLIS